MIDITVYHVGIHIHIAVVAKLHFQIIADQVVQIIVIVADHAGMAHLFGKKAQTLFDLLLILLSKYICARIRCLLGRSGLRSCLCGGRLDHGLRRGGFEHLPDMGRGILGNHRGYRGDNKGHSDDHAVQVAQQKIFQRLKQAVLNVAFQLVLGVVYQKCDQQIVLCFQGLAALSALLSLGWILTSTPDAIGYFLHMSFLVSLFRFDKCPDTLPLNCRIRSSTLCKYSTAFWEIQYFWACCSYFAVRPLKIYLRCLPASSAREPLLPSPEP